ncbi:hypothetical protein Patl1_34097 [Pistacia atlantica]|uniref:Uncharacterized protein n=1 Tax=Pistacia atlantica TaxID=434234 RepID=A0ACC0ZSJ3_9ROSI|nr:hypothetical protein Patl1_34097 [Pistacia atlantica]
MDAAVKKFEVKCLSFEESFELFRQCVTDDVLNSHHQITEFAETVAKECKGLPLALITIGRAMSNRRTPEEWRYAINTLQSYPSEFADMEKDHMIRKDELIDLWIAEGILHYCGLNDTRDTGKFIIRSLKHACLLEMVGDSNDYVKMHDVLRDMALWSASLKENKIFVFENQESIKKHGTATWKEAVRISLWGRSVKLFSETPCCPRLLTFVVRQTSVDTFPSPFFQSMHAMKVLDLSKNIFLTRLPAMLEMINLQYLNLSETDIEELPIMASSLTKLRFLLLDGTRNLKAISEGVISSLSSLQVFSRLPTRDGELLVILCEELHSPNTSSSVLSSGRFDNLHDLYISDCLIKDSACLRYATQLRFVSAENCPSLEEKIPNESSSSSGDLNMFKNLKQLNFSDLPLLKSICRVMHFPSLERIRVLNCPSLTKLPLDLHSENNSRISILGDLEWWDNLEWENSSSDNFPHFMVDDLWSDGPNYTYEATKFGKRYVSSVFLNPI